MCRNVAELDEMKVVCERKSQESFKRLSYKLGGKEVLVSSPYLAVRWLYAGMPLKKKL